MRTTPSCRLSAGRQWRPLRSVSSACRCSSHSPRTPHGVVRSDLEFLDHCSNLVTEPLVGRIGSQSRMPGHLVLETRHFIRRLDEPHASALFKLERQPPWRRENHVALRHSENCRHKVWYGQPYSTIERQ